MVCFLVAVLVTAIRLLKVQMVAISDAVNSVCVVVSNSAKGEMKADGVVFF